MIPLSALSFDDLQALFARPKPKERKPEIVARPDATRVAPKPSPSLPQRTIRAQSESERIVNEAAKEEQRRALARAVSPIGAGVVELARSTFDAGKETRGQVERGEYGKAALNTVLNVLPDAGIGEAVKVGGLTIGAMKGLKKAAGVIGDVAPSARAGAIGGKVKGAAKSPLADELPDSFREWHTALPPDNPGKFADLGIDASGRVLHPRQIPVAAIEPLEKTDPTKVESLTRQFREDPSSVPPILVRDYGGGEYAVIDGHHRLQAAKNVGFTDVPAAVYQDADMIPPDARQLRVSPRGGWKSKPVLDLAPPGTHREGMNWPPWLGTKEYDEWVAAGRPKNRPGFINPLGSRKKIPTGETYTAPLDAGADPRILNLSKLNLSKDAEDRLRAILPPEGEKTVITHEAQQQLAREWETVPEELKKALPQDWSPAQHLAAANIVSENMERIVQLSPKVTDMAIPLAEREAAQMEINRLTHDVTEFTGGISKSREAGGRRLNAFKILANRSMEPSTWLVQAERAKGVPLSVQEQAAIHGFIKENNREGLVQLINGLYKSHPVDQILGLWKAGMLTAFRTHEINAASNVGMAVAESAKDVPATAIDRMISLVRNERDELGNLRKTKSASIRGNIIEPVKAIPQGFRDAKTELVRQVKGVPDVNSLQKYDFRNTNYDNWFGSDFWNGYTRTVFGTLSASDKVGRAVNVARSVEEQLRLKGKTLAKAAGTAEDGPEFDAFIDGLRKAPPDNIMINAIADAEYATFTKDNTLAAATTAFKGKLNPGGRLLAEGTAPFVRTPTNIAGAVFDYSPLGMTRAFKLFKKSLTEADQKELAEQLGRTVTGSGSLVLLGFMLAKEGKATGAAPSQGSGERAMWEQQKKLPNAVMINGKWRQTSAIAPVGTLVSLGAQMHDVWMNAESTTGAVAGSALAIPRVVLDQSMLRGVSGTLQAANDPARYGEKLFENTAGSIVPAGVAAIARATDPIVRDPDGATEAIMARIPGLSDKVTGRVLPLGEDMEREGGALGALFDPVRSQTPANDPLLDEMERLGLAPRIAGKTYKSNGITVKRTPEEQREFQRIYGWYQRRNMGMALGSPALTTDEEKQSEGERALTAARRSAARDTRPPLGGRQQFVKVGKKKR